MKSKVAIITSGYFPIPPVQGGAVEILVNILYEENRDKQEMDLSIYSVYEKDAEAISDGNETTHIIYIQIPNVVKALDKCAYFVFKNILRKKKNMSYRYIFQRLYYINAVSKDISKRDYDFVVVENHPTLLGVFTKYGNTERYKGKYYYHAHNEITKTFGFDDALQEAKGFICVSKYIGNKIHESFPKYPIKNITVLRNRVDENKFRDIDHNKIQKFMEKYNIPVNYILFTFSGRLNPEKGVKELLEAYKTACPKNSKLVIAGSYYFGSGIKSGYEEELQRLSEDMKEEIIFTGHIDYEDMPCMYAISDVVILPSIWDDPAPLTVIESLTCGKPLITTYSGGIPEYANSQNSIILKIDEELVKNLANAIASLANDLNKRKALIDGAKKESSNWKKKDYYYEFKNLLLEN